MSLAKSFCVQIQLCDSRARVPEFAHPGDAAADLYCIEGATILPGCTVKLSLGFKTAFANTVVAILKDRSGNASKGLFVHGGVIDSSYRGEWAVLLYNSTNESMTILPGDRVAQLLLVPRFTIPFELTDELSPTSRGAGGFGSTGR